MSTGFSTGGKDLYDIFKNKILATPGVTTNYRVGTISGDVDISNFFEPLTSSTKANTTSILFKNIQNDIVDLNTVFEPKTSSFETYVGIGNPFDTINNTTTSASITAESAYQKSTLGQGSIVVIPQQPNPIPPDPEFAPNVPPPPPYYGYIYLVSSQSVQISTQLDVPNTYILLIGGGGGGGSGKGYNGGGAGGQVVSVGPITLPKGNYTLTIGNGGIGSQVIDGSSGNGLDGDNSTLVGPTGFASITALGGGGGKGADQGFTGARGTNANSNNEGWGGQNNIVVTNVSGTGSAFGNNGKTYVFQDGTNISFTFAGGGGGGGSNSSGLDGIIYGGGGSIISPYTLETGGCGGTGYAGNVFGDPGQNIKIKTDKLINSGSGGGASGNNSTGEVQTGGNGCDGLCVIYYPYVTASIPPFTTNGKNEIFTDSSGNYMLKFLENGYITASQNLDIEFTLVGGGGGGGAWSSYYSGFAAGGGGHVLSTSSTTKIRMNSGSTWNITIGSGGASGGGQQNNPGKIGNNTSISSTDFNIQTNNSLYSGQGGIGLIRYSSNAGGGPGGGVTSANGGTMSSTTGLLSGSGGAAGSLTYIDASGTIIEIIFPLNGGNSTTGVAGNGSNGFQGIDGAYYGGGGGGGELINNLPASQIGGFGGTGGGGKGVFFKWNGNSSPPTFITPPTNGIMNTGGGGGGGGDTEIYISGMGGSGVAVFKISEL